MTKFVPHMGRINAAKTHCVHGHRFTPENTYVTRQKSGLKRNCRTCMNAATERYRARKREART